MAGFTVAPDLKHRGTLPTKYYQFSELFNPKTFAKLPKHRSYDHAINLMPGEQPPWGPVYPLSELELKALREFLDSALKSGKISPSRSPAGAPILFVPKPEGRGLRLCVDYRGLNKITIRNRYPLPLMDELRDRVTGAKRFTKLDLMTAYNNIRIKEGDEYKTAFRISYDHFEWNVISLGLYNAPAIFQEYINDLLREYLDQRVIVYLDDILIYSVNKDEYTILILKVLKTL